MTAVLIPWKGSEPHRVRALEHVLDWWDRHHPEFTVIVGNSFEEWSKAVAVRNALEQCDDDTLFIADADVLPADPRAITDALDALQSHGWAIPHSHVWRWNEQATQQILNGEQPDPKDVTQRPYQGWAGGGITAITRALYQAVPLDPRYVGWGQEDESWAAALACLAGKPWRGTTDLWHLYHPPQERMSRKWGSPESKQLGKRYAAAANNPQAMRQILEEVR